MIMTNKKKVLVGSFTAVVAVGAIAASVTSANFEGNSAKREAVQRALESRDMHAFHDATKGSTWADDIDTKREFDAMILSHSLRQDGKYKEAREVLENVGIEHPGRMGKHGPRGDMRDAIAQGDWKEFQQETQEKHISRVINTPEKFEQLVEAHELHAQGQHIEARTIIQKLGLHGRHM